MDELLSLFDGNTADEEAVAANVRSEDVLTSRDARNNDVFASAFNQPVQKNDKSLSSKVNQSTSKALPALNKPTTTVDKVSKNNQAVCDPITGFRITDRKTSRADMVDHFALRTYKSVSMLAASSRSEWATYTTDGSEKGPTNLATCGVIVVDTASRISSSTGRAFAMIQLGDLTSSPSGVVTSSRANNNIHALVTVFLFGEALGVIKKQKRFLQKGWVCAILSPSLMPSRDGSSTAVSLSVNHPRQILLIGRSVDCGNCKGTIRKKVVSEYGTKWEDVGCSNLIDFRHGSGYCQTHRRQGLSSRGSTNTSKTPDNRLQKLRADNKRSCFSHTTAFSSQTNVSSQSAVQGGNISLSLSEALSQPGLLEKSLPSATTAITSSQHLQKAPKHMKKAVNANAKVSNPYTKAQKTEQGVKRKDNGISTGDILGQALERKKVRLDNKYSEKKSNVKSTKVFQAEGYDGQVRVPKPSSLFRKAALSNPMDSSSNANRTSARTDILEKQRNLAELLQQKKDGIVNRRTEDILCRLSSRTVGTSSSSANGTAPRNNFASSFGDSNTLDRDTLLHAQSRFASAANAQEYARARGAIQELEAKEFEADQRKQRKNATDTQSKTTTIVTAGWICRSCKKKTPFQPVSCIRARHDVQQQRELKNRVSSVGSTKERLQRHGKDADEGGLTLGSGLEWSWRSRG